MMTIQFGARITDAKKQAEARREIQNAFKVKKPVAPDVPLYASSSLDEVQKDLSTFRDSALTASLPAVHKAYIMLNDIQEIENLPEVFPVEIAEEAGGVQVSFALANRVDNQWVLGVSMDTHGLFDPSYQDNVPKTASGATLMPSSYGKELEKHVHKVFGKDAPAGHLYNPQSPDMLQEGLKGFIGFVNNRPRVPDQAYFVLVDANGEGSQIPQHLRRMAGEIVKFNEGFLADVREKDNTMILRLCVRLASAPSSKAKH